MRILMLNFERGFRGGERQTLLCLRRLKQTGYDVALIARAGSELADAAINEGIRTYIEKSRIGVCKRLLLLRKSYDIFHAQTANMLTWLVIMKPFLKGYVVFTRRTAFPISKRESFTKLKWRQVDLFVAVIEAAAAEPRRLGVKVDVIIPSAIEFKEPNEDNIKALREQFVGDSKYCIATAAALTPEKGTLTLIKAINVLHKQRDDFVFVHFGGGGASEAEARALVSKLGLEKVYKFAGFRSDISDCFRIMDVFVLASEFEAQGGSVLEAFMYGVPVTCTFAGGLKEVISQGRGLGCEVGDYQGMASNIKRLLDDKLIRESQISKASKLVYEKHTPDSMVKQYIDAYKRLVKQ